MERRRREPDTEQTTALAAARRKAGPRGTLEKLRVFRVLFCKEKREIAKDYVW